MRLATPSLVATFCALLSFTAVASQETADWFSGGGFKKTKKVLGYYPIYNYKIQFPSQLNYDLYTDVAFFAAIPESDYTFSYPKISTEIAERLAEEFVKEAREHNVGTLMSFGGWTGSLHISNLTSTDESRKRFAYAIVGHAKRLGFGGVDLSWQYPNNLGIGCNAILPEDTVNFGLLCKEIRALWPEVQLTASIGIYGLVGADGDPATSQETSLLVQYLDFANLLAFEVFGAWTDTTGPIAPISGHCDPKGSGYSVQSGIAALLKQGFSADHIILGIPAYGRRLELVSPVLEVTRAGGIPSYYYQNHTKVTPPGGPAEGPLGLDICGKQEVTTGDWLVKELIDQGWLSQDQRSGGRGYVRHYDKCSGESFLTNGKYLISYDDQDSTVAKAEVAKQNGLAGIFVFDTQGAPDMTISEARKVL